MKYDKPYFRKKFILKRKKNFTQKNIFNFDSIFKLIGKKFYNKKIIIGGYYPSNYEVNILQFLEKAEKKKFKITLPVIKPSNKMKFENWKYKDPLYVSKFGTLEPKISNKKNIPDLVLVPLVAFDNKLNRIGYGKGYYDRSLQKIRKIKKNSIFLGIAFYFQKCSTIPVNKNDFKLDCILTERGIISSAN